jgi:uncharacterized membrane protein
MHSRLDQIFKISLWLKALDAILEVIGGSLLFFITPHFINHWAEKLTHGELSTNPHDFFANLILHSANHLTVHSTTYAAIYLLIHGVVKLVALAAVLKDKFWGYPLLIIVLMIFIVYQTIQLTHQLTYGLLGLDIFDSFVLVLTILEWRKKIIKYEAEHSQPKPSVN